MQLKFYKYGYLVSLLFLLFCMMGWLFSGCAIAKRGIVTMGKTKVVSPEQAETASSVKETTSFSTLPIPAGTTFSEHPMPRYSQDQEMPLKSVYLPSDSVLSTKTTVKEAVVSPQRGPDKDVALRKEANSARMPLLYAAIGSVAVGLCFMVMRWPTAATGAGGAAVVFFIAWQAAGLPDWFYMLGVVLLVAAACVVLGYKRAEWDANKDGIPDFLQKKRDGS